MQTIQKPVIVGSGKTPRKISLMNKLYLNVKTFLQENKLFFQLHSLVPFEVPFYIFKYMLIVLWSCASGHTLIWGWKPGWALCKTASPGTWAHILRSLCIRPSVPIPSSLKSSWQGPPVLGFLTAVCCSPLPFIRLSGWDDTSLRFWSVTPEMYLSAISVSSFLELILQVQLPFLYCFLFVLITEVFFITF